MESNALARIGMESFCKSGLVLLVAAMRPAEALAGTLAKQSDLVNTCNG